MEFSTPYYRISCSILWNLLFHIMEEQIPGVLIKVEWAVSYWSAIVRIHFECPMRLHCPNVPNLTLHYIVPMFYVIWSQHYKVQCYITFNRLYSIGVCIYIVHSIGRYIYIVDCPPTRFQCWGQCSPVTPNSMSLTIDALADWKCHRFCSAHNLCSITCVGDDFDWHFQITTLGRDSVEAERRRDMYL